jgi:hypothetical protein
MSAMSAEIIYEWRDRNRPPEIEKDILAVSKTFGTDQVFENARAYVDYLCNYYEQHEDIERDTCGVLVKKGGVYDQYLLEAFLEWVGSEDEIDEFHANGITESSFFDYMNAYKETDLKRELLFRYLKCYEILYSNTEMFNFENEKFNKLLSNELTIPSNFKSEYATILTNLFKRVCLILSAKAS